MWITDWTARAACKGTDPDELFVQGAAQNRAKLICRGCTVRTECLADALDNRIEFGVWGGMTERERRALLRRRPDVTSWRELLEHARNQYERTSDEYEQMKTHSVLGEGIILAAEMPIEARWVRHHHERIDGAGYPDALVGAQIPLESRIIHVADAFEAMTSDRPYRDAPGEEFAVAELQRHAGTQFDGDVVDALLRVIGTRASSKPLFEDLLSVS